MLICGAFATCPFDYSARIQAGSVNLKDGSASFIASSSSHFFIAARSDGDTTQNNSAQKR
jgi:hypothetical protein